MPKRDDVKSILILGAGPIVIGRLANLIIQELKHAKLCEKRATVILVNSNPATIMTDPSMADVTYIEPVEWRTVEKILRKKNLTFYCQLWGVRPP